MKLFRRKPVVPEEVDAAFGRVAVEVDGAQRALLAAIPTARDEGVPLGQAIAEMLDRLRRAEALMPAWQHETVTHEWTNCDEALAQAREQAERLRLEPGEIGFERLNVRIGDVLHPLETFADVERRFRGR